MFSTSQFIQSSYDFDNDLSGAYNLWSYELKATVLIFAFSDSLGLSREISNQEKIISEIGTVKYFLSHLVILSQNNFFNSVSRIQHRWKYFWLYALLRFVRSERLLTHFRWSDSHKIFCILLGTCSESKLKLRIKFLIYWTIDY